MPMEFAGSFPFTVDESVRPAGAKTCQPRETPGDDMGWKVASHAGQNFAARLTITTEPLSLRSLRPPTKFCGTQTAPRCFIRPPLCEPSSTKETPHGTHIDYFQARLRPAAAGW